jgi:hypothetical protein
MKNLTHPLFFVVILLVAACVKEKAAVKPKVKVTATATATLPGKWKVVGNMISSGGPMYFVAASATDYVSFNTDGTLVGSAFPDYKLYTVKDTITLKMTSADESTYENYFYKIKHDTLTLGLAGPNICIEGCAVILVKE